MHYTHTLANIILKTFTAILISLLVSSASAQDADSVSLLIQNRIKDKVFRELFEQGIFEYQDKALGLNPNIPPYSYYARTI